MKFDISLYVLLFVVVLGVADGSSEEKESYEIAESSEDDKIIGGVNALTDKNPYQASLREVLSGRHFCAAVLISTECLLTTAYCVIGRTPSSMYVAVGSKYLTFGYTRYNVKSIVSHPSYDPFSSFSDMAIIQTLTGMAIGILPELNRVKISNLYPSKYRKVQISGWGLNLGALTIYNTLQVHKTRTMNKTECQSQLSRLGITVTSSNLCTYSKIRPGSCFGDYGSPVMIDNKVVALVSRSIACGQGYPDVNIAILPFKSWIIKTILDSIFE